MADEKKPKSSPADPMKDLIWLVGVLLVLGLMWFLSNGPERSKDQKKPLLDPTFQQSE